MPRPIWSLHGIQIVCAPGSSARLHAAAQRTYSHVRRKRLKWAWIPVSCMRRLHVSVHSTSRRRIPRPRNRVQLLTPAHSPFDDLVLGLDQLEQIHRELRKESARLRWHRLDIPIDRLGHELRDGYLPSSMELVRHGKHRPTDERVFLRADQCGCDGSSGTASASCVESCVMNK
jgi:hypothetical protein